MSALWRGLDLSVDEAFLGPLAWIRKVHAFFVPWSA